ncbi:MAG: ABC transporter ATP-binding protein [Longimonas sp.]|uniref:ABC transporter ATP-binding protein n=1 Tax=Longimonas sp. TaxID=2039626 RepID=UPI003976AFB1
MTDPILTVDGITKSYTAEGPPAVDRVSFQVADGEILAVLGPSGCGKTTMLRCIAGFERLSAGSVKMRDRILTNAHTHVPAERRGIGLVFQDYALFPHLSVLKNVMFGLRYHTDLPDKEGRARKALQMVGLQGYADRTPHHLSGGQQQRVALARALAPKPELLLLDEPFSNLDALLRQTTRQEVRTLLKDNGLSAVLVTHDQEEALSFADRVAVMRRGRIEQVGTPEEVYYQPRTLFVAQFLGRTNLLMSDADGTEAETPIGRLPLNRPASGRVLVSLRPEHLTLAAPQNVPDPDGYTPGTVIDRAFKGHDITYRVACDSSEYLVHTSNRFSFQPGDDVYIRPLEPGVVLESSPAELNTSA